MLAMLHGGEVGAAIFGNDVPPAPGLASVYPIPIAAHGTPHFGKTR